MPDFKFCPYCGKPTIESTTARTYCYTCGEDVHGEEELEQEIDTLTTKNEELQALVIAWTAALAVQP